MSILDCIRCVFTRKDLPDRDIYRIVEQGNGHCRIEKRYYEVCSPPWCSHSCKWFVLVTDYRTRDLAAQAIKDRIAMTEGNKIKEVYTEEDLGL